MMETKNNKKSLQKPHLLVVLFGHLEKDPRVLREVEHLKEDFAITVAAFSAEGVTGIRLVRLPYTACNIRWFIKQCLPKPIVRVLYRLLGKRAPAQYSSKGCWTCRGDAQESLVNMLKKIFYTLSMSIYSYILNKQYENNHIFQDIVYPSLFHPTRQYDIVLAADVHTLPLAFKAARHAPVVFDAHEYFLHEYADSAYTKYHKINARVGRQFVPRCAAMVTVSEGLAKMFAAEYGNTPTVIYNGPEFQYLEPVMPEQGRIRLVHHGGASKERKLELMIEMMQWLDVRFSLDMYLLPQCEYLEYLQSISKSNPRVQILSPVPMTEIAQRLNTYDIGLYILFPTSKNNEHALPNKFFEFIQARLAIAIGPTPDMAGIVRRHNLGVVADDFTPQNLAGHLNRLTTEDILTFKRNAAEAAKLYCAEHNMAKLHSILSSVLAKKE